MSTEQQLKDQIAALQKELKILEENNTEQFLEINDRLRYLSISSSRTEVGGLFFNNYGDLIARVEVDEKGDGVSEEAFLMSEDLDIPIVSSDNMTTFFNILKEASTKGLIKKFTTT